MNGLNNAIALASACHVDQVDKQGMPYILHLLRVMFSVQTHGQTAMVVAVLHDIVEDSHAPMYELRNMFGTEVAEAVSSVSRRSGESYPDFIARASQNRIGRIVKMADISDNLSRIEQLGCEDRKRLGTRYRDALVVLTESGTAVASANKLEAEAREFLECFRSLKAQSVPGVMAAFARKKLEEVVELCESNAKDDTCPTAAAVELVIMAERIRLLMGDEAESREEPDGR